MTVIHQPTGQHHCNVAWEERPTTPGSALFASGILTSLVEVGMWDQPGTVRECQCGKTWVAYRDPVGTGYLVTRWRPEGRFERWNRERKARKRAERSSDIVTPAQIRAILPRIKARHHPPRESQRW